MLTEWLSKDLLFLKKSLVFALIFLFFCYLHILFSEKISQATDEKIQFSEQSREQSSEISVIRALFGSEEEASSFNVLEISSEIVFLGKNLRPDRESDRQVFIQIRSSGEVFCCALDERLYLHGEPFTISSEISPSWIEIQQTEELFTAKLFYQENESTCDLLGSFPLKLEKSSREFEINAHRVDPGFFVRQGVQWYGKDEFMIRHGGDTYKDLQTNERLLFRFRDKTYSRSLKVGEFLAFIDGKWEPCDTRKSSKSALLELVSAQEKTLNFHLWQESGPSFQSLLLSKSEESVSLPSLEWMGFRKHYQYIVQLQNQSLVLEPKDWVLCRHCKFSKLETSDEIDAYIRGDLEGELLVVEGLMRVEGKDQLQIHCFSKNRSKSLSKAFELHRETKNRSLDLSSNASAKSGRTKL